MRLYLGTPNFGWIMYGVGYKSIWFLGFSKRRDDVSVLATYRTETEL